MYAASASHHPILETAGHWLSRLIDRLTHRAEQPVSRQGMAPTTAALDCHTKAVIRKMQHAGCHVAIQRQGCVTEATAWRHSFGCFKVYADDSYGAVAALATRLRVDLRDRLEPSTTAGRGARQGFSPRT